jgi:hypothetical protein
MLNEKAVTLLKKKEIVTTPSTQKIQTKLENFEQKRQIKNKPIKAKG